MGESWYPRWPQSRFGREKSFPRCHWIKIQMAIDQDPLKIYLIAFITTLLQQTIISKILTETSQKIATKDIFVLLNYIQFQGNRRKMLPELQCQLIKQSPTEIQNSFSQLNKYYAQSQFLLQSVSYISTKMMEQPKLADQTPPKHKKSSVCLFIEIAILLTVLSAVAVSLIYYFGTQKIHSDVPHVLDEIFGTKVHKDLIVDLNKKANQHAIIYAANETGIFQFLEHYADVRASKGGLVIVKRVQNNLYETALKFIRYTKEYIEENINLEGQLEKVEWIFIVRNGQLPLDQIERIRTKRPNDKIVIGSVKKIAVKGFKAIKFPAIPIEVVHDAMKADFGVSSKEAQILTNYYGSIPEILAHLNQISYTHEKHLGSHYQNLKDLGKNELKTLKVLCAKGVAPLEGNRAALEEVGVVSFDGKSYWEHRINRLNYELSLQIQCVDKVVPVQIQQKIAKQREEESRAEIEAQNDEVAQPQPPKAAEKQSSKKSQKVQKTATKKKVDQKAATKDSTKTKTKAAKDSKTKSKSKSKQQL